MKTYLQHVLIISEAIRSLKTVPSGHLYARCMNYMDINRYLGIIDMLKNSKLIDEKNNLLVWTGPVGE